MTDSSALVSPQMGDSLELNILRRCTNLIPSSKAKLTVDVKRKISETMSPVMEVTFEDTLGSRSSAILKLYDRRFGTDLRREGSTYYPCLREDEAAFQTFVNQGHMRPFIQELEKMNEESLIPFSAESFRDGTAYDSADEDVSPIPTPDGIAKYEAVQWHFANQSYKNETRAYDILDDLQGCGIPILYAQVCLEVAIIDPGSLKIQKETDAEDYLNVYGILIHVIEGSTLWDLPNIYWAPQIQYEWNLIVQKAMEKMHEINKRGVILKDGVPRNVVVSKSTQTPVIVDFAQCYFKNDLFELWEKMGYGEDGDENRDGGPWKPEIEYWERVGTENNPGGMGCIMENRLQKTHGFKLDIKYVNHAKILEDVRRQLKKDQALAQEAPSLSCSPWNKSFFSRDTDIE